jgi:8-oxo-dGTP pyrophosphatase MutT (NUDIX family)
MLKHSILTHIDAYVTRYPEEAAYVEPLRTLAAAGDVTSRAHFAGHVTAGALLVDREQRYLAIHHKQLQIWLCPGGHLEPGETDPAQSALRELFEETGISPEGIARDPRWPGLPIDIDYHPIPASAKKAEPAHSHWAFLYVFTLDGLAPPRELGAEGGGEAFQRMSRAICMRLFRIKRHFWPGRMAE